MMHKHHVTKACVEMEEESNAVYSSGVNRILKLRPRLPRQEAEFNVLLTCIVIKPYNKNQQDALFTFNLFK